MIDEATLLRYLRSEERRNRLMKEGYDGPDTPNLCQFHFGKETMCRFVMDYIAKHDVKSRTPSTRAATRTKKAR